MPHYIVTYAGTKNGFTRHLCDMRYPPLGCMSLILRKGDYAVSYRYTYRPTYGVAPQDLVYYSPTQRTPEQTPAEGCELTPKGYSAVVPARSTSDVARIQQEEGLEGLWEYLEGYFASVFP